MAPRQPHQQRLFDFANPLEKRLGETFFNDLPQEPGVYLMYDKQGKLLYVGKAKNLRRRLFSYRRVRKETASRKTIRLVRMIHAITYEQLDTEEDALLRENHLLRECRPPFNHANTQPETYYYISVWRDRADWHFALRMHVPDRLDDNQRAYGAFKGHGHVRRSLGALLRQLVVYRDQLETSFLLPSVLVRRLTPMNFRLSTEGFDEQQMNLLWRRVNQYLKGTGSTLLQALMEHAEKKDLLTSQIGALVLEDMERLHTFYEKCTTTNYQIYKQFELENPLIPQRELDDRLVQLSFVDK